MITNKYDYPEILVDVANNDTYDFDVTRVDAISVTQLINPPRMRLLKQRSNNEIVTDVSDMTWSIFGSAVHSLIEGIARKNSERYLCEERIEQVFRIGGVNDDEPIILSGKEDLFDKNKNELMDWKVTSKYTIKSTRKEWEYQMNVLAFLVEKHLEVEVKKLTICAILRDISNRDKKYSSQFADTDVVKIDIPKWDKERVWKYLLERLKLHFNAQEAERMPLCTDEERWRAQDKYAVISKGASRADKLYDTLEEAKVAIQAKKPSKPPKIWEIQDRKGEDTRCLDYCSVRSICDYARMLREDKNYLQLPMEDDI